MSEVVYTSPTERVNTWLDGSTLFIQFNNVARHNALSVDMWAVSYTHLTLPTICSV